MRFLHAEFQPNQAKAGNLASHTRRDLECGRRCLNPPIPGHLIDHGRARWQVAAVTQIDQFRGPTAIKVRQNCGCGSASRKRERERGSQ